MLTALTCPLSLSGQLFRDVFIFYSVLFLSGSLSEEAPPPPRGLAMGRLASRSSNPMALARSLPVSVPVWGYRNNHAPQGDSHSGERVSNALAVKTILTKFIKP